MNVTAKNVAILTKTFVTWPRHSLVLGRFDPGFDRFAWVIDSFADHGVSLSARSIHPSSAPPAAVSGRGGWSHWLNRD
jgi:hypothetical protein